MNLKSILLSVAFLASVFCKESVSIQQIPADSAFFGVVQQIPVSIVAIVSDSGGVASQIVIANVAGVESNGYFPGVRFFWANQEDVPQACGAYQIYAYMVAVFRNGKCIGRIYLDPTNLNQNIVNKLKSILGGSAAPLATLK